ncbi:hypothetical protein GCM10025857_12010 [Alicyclobacillus contaminans]|uniref:hypothetical protein n=1 Tax=Alicyclobacillus contaminans TaxID=392016 RepID=UPI000403F9A4|nr:hypothetical protein [Alicyclobacillus contaminans]GMA49844.1 hypothetical protein GCM10025857_12010 [Alicyclobacillus contaminans]
MFGRRKKAEQLAAEQMLQLTQRLIEALDKASEHRIQVIVQSLHVDKGALEQLVFKLDSLDIDELSGSLNLGNNFGTDVVRPKSDVHIGGLKSAEQSSPKAAAAADGGWTMEHTGNGFKVKRPNAAQ